MRATASRPSLILFFRSSVSSPVKRDATRSTPLPARTGSSESSSSTPDETARTASSAAASIPLTTVRIVLSLSRSCGLSARRRAIWRSRLARLPRSTHRAISASSPRAARVSPGVSHRLTKGQIHWSCWPPSRSRRISPEMTCQRVRARSQGTAKSAWARNHSPSILPVSWLLGPAGSGLSRLLRIPRPSCSPSSGGTALPIWRNAADGGPANRYRSGNVCSRAASRTVRVRLSRGWIYQ